MSKIALAVFLIVHGLVHAGMGVRTSRGFLSRSITNHTRNPILHPLLAQFNPREVLCEHSLANGRRGLRLPLAAADTLLASLAGSGHSDRYRNFDNAAVGKIAATGHDWRKKVKQALLGKTPGTQGE